MARATTKIATLNVHSLCSAAKLDELAKLAQDYKLDIVALTEVHRTGTGVVPVTHPDLKSKYFLLYSGPKERKEQGVGLLLSARAYNSLDGDWSAISPRLLRARFRSPQARLTMIVAYAPTLASDDAVHDEFYDSLDSLLNTIPRHDITIPLGDFNAHIGSRAPEFRNVLGPWTNPAPRNKSGYRLLDLCAQHNLVITNTWHQHKPIHRDTFTSPDGKFTHTLDLVLNKRRHFKTILDTRVHRGARAYIETDHELVVSKLRVKLTVKKRKTAPPHLNSNFLSTSERTREQFQEEMKRAYEARKEQRSHEELSNAAEINTEWLCFKDSTVSATAKTCGRSKKRMPFWQSPELLNEIDLKRESYLYKLDTKTNLSNSLAPEPPLEAKYIEALELKAEIADIEYKAARKACSKASYKAKGEFWAQAATELENSYANNEVADAYQRLRSYLRQPTKKTTDLAD